MIRWLLGVGKDQGGYDKASKDTTFQEQFQSISDNLELLTRGHKLDDGSYPSFGTPH